MTHAAREFAVDPPSPLAYGLLAAIWLAVTAFALVRADASAWHAGPAPWWIVPPFAAALLLVGPLILLSRRGIAIDGGELQVAGGLTTRKVAAADLQLDQARMVDLDEHTEFKPMLKLFGIDLPGYKSGDYLLRNRARAFVLLTRGDKVLLLPQGDGRCLLLSPQRPQALLDALRAIRAGAARG